MLRRWRMLRCCVQSTPQILSVPRFQKYSSTDILWYPFRIKFYLSTDILKQIFSDIFIRYTLSVYKDVKKRILLYVKRIFLDKKMVCVTSLRRSIRSLSENWKKIAKTVIMQPSAIFDFWNPSLKFRLLNCMQFSHLYFTFLMRPRGRCWHSTVIAWNDWAGSKKYLKCII